MMVITFILLVVLLFQPWINSSSVATSSIETVMIKKFLQIAESYNSTISSFLSRYMIASKFLSGIMNNPSLMQCDLPFLPHLVRATTAVFESLTPRPRYMYMWQENRFCQIAWKNTSKSNNHILNNTPPLNSIKLASKPITDLHINRIKNPNLKKNDVILIEISDDSNMKNAPYDETDKTSFNSKFYSFDDNIKSLKYNQEEINLTREMQFGNQYDDSKYQYSDFTLNYIEQISPNTLSSTTFNKSTNFRFPPNSTIFTSDTNINFEYGQYRDALWITQASFINDGDPNDDISAISPNIFYSNVDKSQKTVAVSGVVISISQIANELQLIPDTYNCKYAILNQNDEVMIDDAEGCHNPEFIDQNGNPHYKELINLNNFWNQLIQNKYDEILTHEVTRIEINETTYMVINVPVSPMGYQLFTMIFAFSITEPSQKYIYHGSIIFICAITLLAMMFTILLLLLRNLKKRKIKKLAKIKPHEPKFRMIGMNAQLGSIGKSIQKLRNLQLRFPEKEIFNKIMDDAISNLAEQKDKRFSTELKHEHENCEFCRYLVEPNSLNTTSSSSQLIQSPNPSFSQNANQIGLANDNNSNNHMFMNNINNNNNNIFMNNMSINLNNNNFNSHFSIGSNPSHRNQQSSDDAYSIWKSYHASKIPLYKSLGSLTFDWNKFTSAPAKELLRLMITIIVEENLIFKEFDPDSLIQFMQHITTKCCKDNVRTAHELVSLNFLLNTFFKNWISRKIDRFVLYMATFLYNTDSSIAFDLIDDMDDFSQTTEKVWISSSTSSYQSTSENYNESITNSTKNNNIIIIDDNNNNNSNNNNNNNNNNFINEETNNDFNLDNNHQISNNQNDSTFNNNDISENYGIADEESENEIEDQILREKNNLKLHMKAFQDQESIIERNIDFILNLFSIFIPTPKEKAPLVEQFMDMLTEIMIDVQDSKQFELLGEFSCRIESKYFSVSTDRDDRILFMKALIMLSHFCPYWSDVETMLKATERLNHSIFGTNDNENIPEFHFEHSSKIVAPWVSVFMNFSPMDEVVNNLKVNINYWKNKMQ